jgi:hypothetical protein
MKNNEDDDFDTTFVKLSIQETNANWTAYFLQTFLSLNNSFKFLSFKYRFNPTIIL